MQQHMDTMLNLIHKLAAFGEEVKDDMVVAMLLASLPDSYGTLITALEARSPEDLTIDFLKGKLIDEHQWRKNSSAINSSSETAMKVTDSKNYSSRKSACFFCKKPGHQKKECKKYLVWKAQREKETKNSNRKGKVQGIGLWIQEHQATWRAAGNSSKNFKPLNTTVNLARRNIIAKVLGIGTGVIKCLDKDGTQVEVTLKDVLYVPSFDNNVISVRKITKNGFKVLFSYDDCKIISEGRIVAVAAACGNNLYRLATTEATCLSTLEVQHKEDCQHQWHRKFGHRDINAIRKLKIIRSDQGREYVNDDLKDYLQKEGIRI